MRILFALGVVAASLRVAWPLTEGAANCPVAGNWSDADGTKTLRLWRSAQGNVSVPTPLQPNITTHLELNVSDYRFVHEGWNASKPQTIYNSTAFLVVLANVTGPNGYASTDKTIMELLCANDILFVDIFPPADMAPEETSFSLRRRVVSPLSEAPQELPSSSSSSPSSPSISPQFILVNITLPNRQEDDSQGYGKEASQKNEDILCDASVTEEDEASDGDVCCACGPSSDDPVTA